MRRKITPEDMDDSDLPELTEHQYAFVEAFLTGKTASEAYRIAYDCSNMKNTTVWVEASRVKSNPNVSLWIAKAIKAREASTLWPIERWIREIYAAAQDCADSGNHGARIDALKTIGKHFGYLRDQVEISAAADPLDGLQEMAAISPEFARLAAAAQGIDWETKH